MTEPPFLVAPVLLLPGHRRHSRLRLPGLEPPPRPQTCRASSRQVGGGGKGRGWRRRAGAQGRRQNPASQPQAFTGYAGAGTLPGPGGGPGAPAPPPPRPLWPRCHRQQRSSSGQVLRLTRPPRATCWLRLCLSFT